LTEDIALLTSEIEALNAEIAQEESAKIAGNDARNNANGDFAQRLSDAQGTVSSIDQAIASIKGSASLIQQDTALSKITALLDVYAPQEKATKQVHAFLQTRADPIESDNADQFEGRTGTAVTYNFKSGGIIETLKKMKTEFEASVVDLQQQEQGDSAEHALSDAAKAQTIAAATRSRDSKDSIKARKGQDKSTAESDLYDATNARNSATTVLDDTTALCRQRSDEFGERSKRRGGEIAAMGQAIEILEKVSGVRSPESKGVETVGFVQIRKVNDPRAAIINLLRKAGNTKATIALAKLADKIASVKTSATQTPGSGMFDQIKNMIEKMIFQLMSEQTDEDKHKHWCDKELETSTKMQDDKQSKKDVLDADISALSADIQSLTNGITEDDAAVATLAAQISTETADRAAAKAENEATIQDAIDAQKACDAALAVLEDFYKSTGEVAKEAWESFVQLKVSKSSQPDLSFGDEGGEYKGTAGGSGVIGMLENIAADFASMEAEARADETSQHDEFDEWLTTATVNTAEKKTGSEMKSARRETMKETLQGKTTDNDHNNKELGATTQYLADLQHACVDGDSSYAERKAARTQEIEVLRQAQGILDSAAE